MKKKKMIIFHHFGGIGGAGLSLIHIVKSIDKSKFDLVVVCPAVPNEMVRMLEDLSVTVEKTDNTPIIFNHYNGGIKHFFSPRTLVNLMGILFDIRKVKVILRKYNPDIVMLNSMTLFWIGIIMKKNSARKIIFHRETYVRGLFGIRKKFIKWALNNFFNDIIYISNYDLKDTKTSCKIKGNIQHRVIYDKVEVTNYSRLDKIQARKSLGLDKNEDIKYILYLGGFSKLKGYKTIFKLLPYLKNGQKVLFIGRKPSYSIRTFYKLIEIKMIEKKFSNRILFIDPSPEPEIFYKCSDLIIFPSTLPHQSRPIYEAGLAKIPILISDFKQTSEFIVHGKTGYTFNNEEIDELVSTIQYILDQNNKEDIDNVIDTNYVNSMRNHNFNTLTNELNLVLKEESI